IEHALKSEGSFDDEIDLKSASALAKEAGIDLADVVRSQGGLDIVIGNVDYVFANTNTLASYTGGSGMAKNRYKITSEDGYAVPCDIAYTFPERSQAHQDYGLEALNLYADNIYTIADF